MWKFHRSMIRPFFSRDRLIQFKIFDKMATNTIAMMNEMMNAGYAVDLQDLASRYTFDSTTEFLFGLDMNVLGEPLLYPHSADPPLLFKIDIATDGHAVEASRAFSRAFSEAQEAVAPRLQLGAFWPLQEFTKNWAVEPMKIVDRLLLDFVAKNARKGAESTGIDEEDQILLDQLAKQTDGQTELALSK